MECEEAGYLDGDKGIYSSVRFVRGKFWGGCKQVVRCVRGGLRPTVGNAGSNAGRR